MQELDEATIRARVSAWARRKPEVTRVVLFGSRARGDPEPRDTDLALETTAGPRSTPGQTYFAWLPEWREELAALFPQGISVVHMDPEGGDPELQEKIATEGITLYDAPSAGRAPTE